MRIRGKEGATSQGGGPVSPGKGQSGGRARRFPCRAACDLLWERHWLLGGGCTVCVGDGWRQELARAKAGRPAEWPRSGLEGVTSGEQQELRLHL